MRQDEIYSEELNCFAANSIDRTTPSGNRVIDRPLLRGCIKREEAITYHIYTMLKLEERASRE